MCVAVLRCYITQTRRHTCTHTHIRFDFYIVYNGVHVPTPTLHRCLELELRMVLSIGAGGSLT